MRYVCCKAVSYIVAVRVSEFRGDYEHYEIIVNHLIIPSIKLYSI